MTPSVRRSVARARAHSGVAKNGLLIGDNVHIMPAILLRGAIVLWLLVETRWRPERETA